jgi:hypothetical protein
MGFLGNWKNGVGKTKNFLGPKLRGDVFISFELGYEFGTENLRKGNLGSGEGGFIKE